MNKRNKDKDWNYCVKTNEEAILAMIADWEIKESEKDRILGELATGKKKILISVLDSIFKIFIEIK